MSKRQLGCCRSGTVVDYTYTDRKQIATISADGPPSLATFG